MKPTLFPWAESLILIQNKLSADHFDNLDFASRKRYQEKLKVNGNTCLYAISHSDFFGNIGDFPSTCSPHIIN